MNNLITEGKRLAELKKHVESQIKIRDSIDFKKQGFDASLNLDVAKQHFQKWGFR